MKEFKFYSPTTINDCVELLSKNNNAKIVAGGTDVIIAVNHGEINPDVVIDISKIKELNYVKEENEKVKIGAICTFDEIEKNEYIEKNVPVLKRTVEYVGSPQIRNLGTIGGNVVNASVAGDTPTTFTALNAEVVLKSNNGERVMNIIDFNNTKKGSAINENELLTEIRFDKLSSSEAVGYYKVGKRKSLAIVVLAVAIYVKKDAEGKIADSRVVLGAINPHPVRSAKIEEALKGMKISNDEFEKILPLFTEEVDRLIPTRASLVYKREGVRGAAKYAFMQIVEKLSK